MAQIPEKGPLKRDTLVSDYTIEHLSVSVTNTETGRFEFAKQHKFLPVVVFNNLTNESNYHNNIYLTELTNAGQWATGSITIAGGTTPADLNGDTFTLKNKQSFEQVFTFNNSDTVLTNGSIGLLGALDESTIMTRAKTSINNVGALQISAGSITAGSGTSATATDGIIFTAFAVDNQTLTVTLPAGYGADAGKAVEIVFQDTAGMSGTPTANQIFVHQGVGTAAGILNLKRAINGFSNDTTVKYGSGIAGGITSGISSLTAANGTTAARLSLTADITGGLGNSITLATTVTGATVSASLSGGAISQTLEVMQDLTGSAGNTTIDMSGVTGGSSVNFANGNNYGSGSFASNETFTGTLKMRAVSLQREQKF